MSTDIEEPKLGVNTGNAGKGRPKGSPNKATAAIKGAILEAFELAGGVDYLLKVAAEDPRTFCGLLGKVLPLSIAGDEDNPLVLNVTIGGDASNNG